MLYCIKFKVEIVCRFHGKESMATQRYGMAVRLKDSILLGFSRTDKNGTFELSGFSPDTFNLVIEYPGLDPKSYFIFGNNEDDKR